MVVRYCPSPALLVAVFFNFSPKDAPSIIILIHYITTYTFLSLSLSLPHLIYISFPVLLERERERERKKYTQKSTNHQTDREREGEIESMGSSSGQSSNYDLSFKILLIGDSAVGKSSLLVSFISNSVEDLSPTIGTFFFFFFFFSQL